MRIFALETDKNKIIQRFCHEGECVIAFTYYHWMNFALSIVKESALLVLTIGAVSAAIYYGFPVGWTVSGGAIFSFIFVFWPGFKAWIDWCYDFILVTTDKIILVDQTSIIRQEIKPIHLENIGSVSTETQWMGIFEFGQICIHLKEGEGGDKIMRSYVPNARKLAGVMSDVVTRFQRGNFSPAHPSHRQRTPFPEEAMSHPAQKVFSDASDPRKIQQQETDKKLADLAARTNKQ